MFHGYYVWFCLGVKSFCQVGRIPENARRCPPLLSFSVSFLQVLGTDAGSLIWKHCPDMDADNTGAQARRGILRTTYASMPFRIIRVNMHFVTQNLSFFALENRPRWAARFLSHLQDITEQVIASQCCAGPYSCRNRLVRSSVGLPPRFVFRVSWRHFCSFWTQHFQCRAVIHNNHAYGTVGPHINLPV